MAWERTAETKTYNKGFDLPGLSRVPVRRLHCTVLHAVGLSITDVDMDALLQEIGRYARTRPPFTLTFDRPAVATIAVEISGWPGRPFTEVVDAVTQTMIRTGASFKAAPSRYPHIPVAYTTDGAEDVDAVGMRAALADIEHPVSLDAYHHELAEQRLSLTPPPTATAARCGCWAGVFGKLPAVFAGHRGEQCADVVPHAAAWFDAAEAVPNSGEEVVQVSVPGLGCLFGDDTPRLPRALGDLAVVGTLSRGVRAEAVRDGILPATLPPLDVSPGQATKYCWSTGEPVSHTHGSAASPTRRAVSRLPGSSRGSGPGPGRVRGPAVRR